eukprot:CAMPEP_0171205934 /NCGR_PEP_ID=MMETSP0790-20130122/26804_1 /TAXON_ID=2925 /ORGANISM="Alexandrium catenella, Strain OF101" /LENGTH=539 /DNA_ID=CAMNT_0011671465 /DNA_START=62 /DNA_END=1679 /DNA_ORIENTATION=+
MFCGKDLDEVFAYQTVKIVVLKDRKLGLISLFLKLTIFCYIFLWVILHQGKHLSVADVDGVSRLSIRNPTIGMCDPYEVGCRANYTQFHKLPYCRESPTPYLEGNDGIKRPCQIWDSIEAAHSADKGIMLPTRIRRYDQVRACQPSQANDWSCHPAPYEYLAADGSRQSGHGEAEPRYDAFIADIERFTVLIDHNFRRYGGMMEDDMNMNGHYYDCPSSKAHVWECKQTLRGRRRSLAATRLEASDDLDMDALEEVATPGDKHFARLANQILDQPSGYVVALPKGDVFTVGALLKLANTQLDVKGRHSTTNRARGIVVVIHIQYDNRPQGTFLGLQVTPWRTPSPFYSYRITFREATDYRQTKTFNDPADRRRTIRIYNGIRVVMEQSGTIAVWDTPFFLITMTTALGLMAVATTVTDLMLSYFLPLSEEYKKRKFHQSKDFNPEDDATEQSPPAKPTTRREAGSLFLDALESQDADAVADALSPLLEFCSKKAIERLPAAGYSLPAEGVVHSAQPLGGGAVSGGQGCGLRFSSFRSSS